ncbi:NADP-dependent oxidoreductase [Streptomyces boluensis]|uniref:Zinc-binding dehydrogenase n=1 Tax=Streptomyces boluensis TaxID=1775135 RepID=A0A964XK87_9ACTN|nr:NADP-dependent oxidoreductase [Streptomyces boluensis]NBE50452.1 zinc-binding dehydrogenase [Streptomyces boluensis]
MRAVTVSRFGGPDSVEITELPVPEAGPAQVRIKVAAAALNPVDAAMRAGVFGAAERVGLGWDVAGTVDAVGEGAPWSVGDRVIGLSTGHLTPLGTHADYVVLDADAVAAAPSTLDDTQAATLPLNTLSADQALGLLGLRPGQSLLVTGAAGAVGAHAVELAHRHGLVITALAAAGDAEFLASRGADHFVARGAALAPAAFDGVLDAAGLGAEAIAAVRDGGSYAGLWPGQEPRAERGIRIAALDVQADGARLAELARVADEGVLLPRVARTYPLDAAAEAHVRLAEGGLRGRLVLLP